MKKYVYLAVSLLGFSSVKAQNIHEVKWNILNTIVQKSVEVGYEHFIDADQSIGVDVLINDRFSYFGESNKQEKFKKFNTNSIALNYNFYFGSSSGEHASGIYISPFMKYRFGDYEKDVNPMGYYQRATVKMNSFILGAGVGYKLVRNDAFTLAPYVNIGRNFSQEVIDEFMGIEINAGLTIGYRF